MGMWVDWNDDGDFSDANENVKPWIANTISSAGTHTFTMNVPAGASLTSVRMRVMTSNDNSVAACGGYFQGENEEYELVVSSSCSVGSASSSPSVAKDNAMTNITHTTTGVSGITSSSGLPSGVTAGYSSNTVTISGTPTATGTFNYTVDLTGCSDDATGTITVMTPPGGISSNLKLWLKADAGTSSTTDAADVNTWTDQSANAYSASGYSAGGKSVSYTHLTLPTKA